MNRLPDTLKNVWLLILGLYYRFRVFMGTPDLKALAITGGIATLLTIVAIGAAASANPLGVKITWGVVASIAWILSTRASWK
jgi:hypothetical protein